MHNRVALALFLLVTMFVAGCITTDVGRLLIAGRRRAAFYMLVPLALALAWGLYLATLVVSTF
jgi:hypothetical protein